MNKNARILICGSDKMLNSAFLRYFEREKFTNVSFKDTKPDIVIYTGAVSGGISANIKHPAEFIHKNITEQTSVINSAKESNAGRLIFFGSSCVYPKSSPQPIKEEFLLAGQPEETSEAYAVAKIAGIKMCKAYNTQYGTNFIAIVPATIYGPEDDFSLENAHVISALIRKFHEAKIGNKPSVEVWGSGQPRREFIFVDDLVDATVFILDKYKENWHINAGCSRDHSIKELADVISEAVGFKGKITYNTGKPEGVKQKLLDSSKITSLGWKPKVSLKEGINITYNWFEGHV